MVFQRQFTLIVACVTVGLCAESAFAQSSPAKPSCAVPNASPRVVKAADVKAPPAAIAQGISGEVWVLISLDEHSQLVGTPVIQKSPSVILNKAAIEAAQASTYQTEIRDCAPIAEKYIFRVEFAAIKTPAPVATPAATSPPGGQL
jgi:hypothetical protein